MNSQRDVFSSIDERGVAIITINKPKVHNAFDDRLISQLNDTIVSCSLDVGVRLIILASNGKTFCAGADLNWMKKMSGYSFSDNLNDARNASKLFKNIAFSEKLIIAKVNGPAFGGGVGLVAACDIAIGVDTAFFSLSEVRLGLIPSMISPYIIRALGERQATRYMLTGEKFNSNVALQLGLLHQVVSTEALDGTIESLIEEVLLCGPNAIKECKDLISMISNKPIDENLLEQTVQRISRVRASEEAKDGLNAFFKKLPPPWVPNK